MWLKHRLFGIRRESLREEIARRELAVRARLDHIGQKIRQGQTELHRLRTEAARLQVLERDLHAEAAQGELSSHVLALQRVVAESGYLHSQRARLVEQLREVLLPYLASRAGHSPSGPMEPKHDTEGAANV